MNNCHKCKIVYEWLIIIHVMKIIILLTLLALISCKLKYKLTIYQANDCSYCKYATKQIKSVHAQNHWEDILDLVVVDCQIDIKLCKDSSKKPMLILLNSDGVKLGQIGGVRSKIYFQDWIANIINKNPIKTQNIIDDLDKFKKIVIKNKEQVKQFYLLERSRQRKIQNDKLDILKVVRTSIKQEFIDQNPYQNWQNEENLIQNNDQGSFRSFFRGIAVICKYLLLLIIIYGCIIWIKGYLEKRNGSRPILVNEYDEIVRLTEK